MIQSSRGGFRCNRFLFADSTLRNLVRHSDLQLLVSVAEVVIPCARERVDARRLWTTRDSSHGSGGVVQQNIEFISTITVELSQITNVLVLWVKSTGQEICLDILCREVGAGIISG